jgi:nitrogen fixation/metabolism regulation signal transduction histidine kinase
MFKNRSIKIKLIGAFSVTALLIIMLSYFNVQAIGRIHDSFSDIMDDHLPRLVILQSMRVTAVRVDNETTAYQGLTRGAEAETRKNALLAHLDKLTDQEKDYLILVNRGHGHEKNEILAGFKTISAAKERTVNAVFELIALKEQQAQANQIAAKETELHTAETTLQATLTENIEHDLQTIRTDDARADAQVNQIALAALLTAGVGSIFAIGVGLVISIGVARNIQKLRVGSARIAGGDFSSQIEVKSQDELGDLARSFNQMSASLRASYSRLALEKERDEILLESMNEGMVALDAKGNIVLMNSVAAEMLHIENKQAVTGKNLAGTITLFSQGGKLLAPGELPSSLTLQNGETINQAYGYHTSDKRTVLLNIASSPVKFENKVGGAILILRDVTKEREVDRMKTEFISLASHQLRTPLSAIKWFGA